MKLRKNHHDMTSVVPFRPCYLYSYFSSAMNPTYIFFFVNSKKTVSIYNNNRKLLHCSSWSTKYMFVFYTMAYLMQFGIKLT